MSEKQPKVEVKLDPQDAMTLGNLARSYATGSAHVCLWDRLAQAIDEATREGA